MATDLITSWSRDEVIKFLLSEIKNESRAEISDKVELTNEYWEFIISRINIITQEYPESIPKVMRSLIENFITLKDNQEGTAVESATFLRNVLIDQKDQEISF